MIFTAEHSIFTFLAIGNITGTVRHVTEFCKTSEALKLMTLADTGILASVRLIILCQDSANVKSSELVTESYGI